MASEKTRQAGHSRSEPAARGGFPSLLRRFAAAGAALALLLLAALPAQALGADFLSHHAHHA